MTQIHQSKFPQIFTNSTNTDWCRERGFKFNRLYGVAMSSSVATAKRELSPDTFAKYIKRIKNWNTIQSSVAICPTFRPRLRDYQIEGVTELMKSRSLLLGDEMGLGKTIQCAVALSSLGESAIVVCPNHLVRNWMSELAKWTSGLTITAHAKIKPGTRWELGRGHVHVVPYSQIHNLASGECGVLVCDESHFLNSGDSRRTKGVHGINAKRRWFLSGTAFKNHPTELWSQFILLKVSEFMGGSKSGFELGFGLSELIQGETLSSGPRFGRGKAKQKRIPTHLKPIPDLTDKQMELMRVAMSPFYLRRDKSNHLDLPPKIRTFYRFGSPLKSEKQMVGRFENLELGELLSPGHVSEIAEMRISSALRMIKSKDFKNYSEMLIGHPVIVFAYHNDVLDALTDYFMDMNIPVGTIVKGDTASDIENIVEWFQNADHGVLIISIRKGSTGLTLTNAKKVCFVELDWTMADLDQCESRMHRFGKTGSALIDYVMTDGGVDDLVLNKLQPKERNNKILEEI